jgi:hypothetical protein
MSRAKNELKKWAPQRGKKVMGIPEWFGFLIVMVFAIALVFFIASAH